LNADFAEESRGVEMGGCYAGRGGDIVDEGWILGLGIRSWATLGVLPVLTSLDKKSRACESLVNCFCHISNLANSLFK